MQEKTPGRVFDDRHRRATSRSPVQPAWRQLVYDRSLLFTQRSYLGRGSSRLRRCPPIAVVFCLDRAGPPRWCEPSRRCDSPALEGAWHALLAPSNADELEQMLSDAVDLADEGPIVIRYPRGVLTSD